MLREKWGRLWKHSDTHHCLVLLYIQGPLLQEVHAIFFFLRVGLRMGVVCRALRGLWGRCFCVGCPPGISCWELHCYPERPGGTALTSGPAAFPVELQSLVNQRKGVIKTCSVADGRHQGLPQNPFGIKDSSNITSTSQPGSWVTKASLANDYFANWRKTMSGSPSPSRDLCC